MVKVVERERETIFYGQTREEKMTVLYMSFLNIRLTFYRNTVTTKRYTVGSI